MNLSRRNKRGKHFILYYMRSLSLKSADFKLVEDKRKRKAGKSLNMLLSILPPPPLLPMFKVFELHGHSRFCIDTMLDVSSSYTKEIIETCFSDCLWMLKVFSKEQLPSKPESSSFKEKLIWMCINVVYLLSDETLGCNFKQLVKLAAAFLYSPDLFKTSTGLVMTFLIAKRRPELFKSSRESKNVIMQIFKLRSLNVTCDIASEQEKWLVQQADWLWLTLFKPHLRDYFDVNVVDIIDNVTMLIEEDLNEFKRTAAMHRLLHSLLYGDISADEMTYFRVTDAFLEFFDVSVFKEESQGKRHEHEQKHKQRIRKFIEIVTNIVWDEHPANDKWWHFEKFVDIVKEVIEACFDDLLAKLQLECNLSTMDSPYRIRDLNYYVSFCPIGSPKKCSDRDRPGESSKNDDDEHSARIKFPLWGSFYYFDDVVKSAQLFSILHFINNHVSFLVQEQMTDNVIVDNNKFLYDGLLKRGRLQSRFISQPSQYWWLYNIIKTCPFLVPFDQRRTFLVFSGLSKHKLIQSQGVTVVFMNREKMTVSRGSPLASLRSLDTSAFNKDHFWDFEFEEELAKGDGPTKEFYELLSRDVQRHDLKLWIGESLGAPGEPQYTHANQGLYPSPVPRNLKPEDLVEMESNFFFIGKLTAKAIKDFKLLSIPFNLIFYKWILCWGSNRDVMEFNDFLNACPHLSVMAQDLLGILTEKRAIEENPNTTSDEKQRAIDLLTYDGCPFEDLCLDFTLPCYPDIEMVEGGRNVPLTPHNLEKYLDLLVEWYLRKGPELKLNAFRRGFESVMFLDQFTMFYPKELELLVTGEVCQHWTKEELRTSCLYEQGYTVDSQQVDFLFEVLESLAVEEQTLFLQFVASLTRLPPGGLKSLLPPLSICPLETDDPDQKLPTAATCFNIIHLPRYTSLEVTREKLLFAVNEGRNVFGFI